MAKLIDAGISNLGDCRWHNLEIITPMDYVCGYCGNQVGSNSGYYIGPYVKNAAGNIYICPRCSRPTYIEGMGEKMIVIPGTPYGEAIEGLPETVDSIYNEARNTFGTGAYTATILVSRKILANVAVYLGAKDGQNFTYYVDYLVDNGYVPAKSREWIDAIRVEGNSATHDVTSKNEEDARRIMSFVQMLLLINFKFNSDYQSPAKNES